MPRGVSNILAHVECGGPAIASNLLLPIIGFLPATDPRMRQTVDLVERKLMGDGFVYRHDTNKSEDGMPEGEGAFLACIF